MRLKDFYDNYDLKECNLVKVELTNNTLVLDVEVEIHLDYIANGLRPNFDFHPIHEFIFLNVDVNEKIISPYKLSRYEYIDNKLYLTINNVNLIINDCDIKCIQNVQNRRP